MSMREEAGMMQRADLHLVSADEAELISRIAELDKRSVGADAWSAETLAEECRRDGGYVLACTDENGALAGFAVFSSVLDEGCLNSIAVSEAYRRQGIGRLIIGKMTEIFAESGIKTISLEVRESNTAAVTLYERCGFHKAGIRRNFYREPKENAIIYLKGLS